MGDNTNYSLNDAGRNPAISDNPLPCGLCGSPQGRLCRTAEGREAWFVHMKRINSYKFQLFQKTQNSPLEST